MHRDGAFRHDSMYVDCSCPSFAFDHLNELTVQANTKRWLFAWVAHSICSEVSVNMLTIQHQRLELNTCNEPCGMACPDCNIACTASCHTCHELTVAHPSGAAGVAYDNGLITPPPDKVARTRHAAHRCGHRGGACGHGCEVMCSATHSHSAVEHSEKCDEGKALNSLKECVEVHTIDGMPCELTGALSTVLGHAADRQVIDHARGDASMCSVICLAMFRAR